MQSVHVRLEDEVHRKLKAVAGVTAGSISAYVARLVMEKMNSLPDPPEEWQ